MAAIKSVILHGNQAEERALATHDPALMRSTSTPAYYDQLVQELSELASSGIEEIQLVNLRWGSITLQGATARATTVETWRTALIDGSVLIEAPDTNVYWLVQEAGAWKIESDEHPDSQRLRPPSETAPGAPGTVTVPTLPSTPLSPGQSLNWAGYVATGGTFTGVSGTWTVPTVKAVTSPAADATWVGIGGVSSHDLIQAGTTAIVQSGKVSYTAWLETLPQPSQTVPLTVTAGNQISVSIAQQPGGLWKIVIHDVTTGKSYQASGSYGSTRSSAEWIEEAPTTGQRLLLPLDNFGTVKFTGATTVEKGKSRTIAQAGGKSVTMYGPTDQPLAKPSALGSNGSSFSVTRTNVVSRPTVP